MLNEFCIFPLVVGFTPPDDDQWFRKRTVNSSDVKLIREKKIYIF